MCKEMLLSVIYHPAALVIYTDLFTLMGSCYHDSANCGIKEWNLTQAFTSPHMSKISVDPSRKTNTLRQLTSSINQSRGVNL